MLQQIVCHVNGGWRQGGSPLVIAAMGQCVCCSRSCAMLMGGGDRGVVHWSLLPWVSVCVAADGLCAVSMGWGGGG